MNQVIEQRVLSELFIQRYRNYPDNKKQYRELFKQIRLMIKNFDYKPTIFSSFEMIKLEKPDEISYYNHIQHSLFFIEKCLNMIDKYELYKFSITNKSVILELKVKI